MCCSVEFSEEESDIRSLRARGEALLPVRILSPPRDRSLRQLRADFPILQRQVQGRPFVYLDNACMALRPQVVLDAMQAYYGEYSGCHGRAQHAFGTATTAALESARRSLQAFIGARQASEVIFTKSTTEAINLVARGLGLQAGNAVLCSDLEHNSNLLPWRQLQREEGVEHRVFPTTLDTRFDMGAFKARLDGRVKLVSVLLSSNLSGVSFPLEEIVHEAHRVGAMVLADAAQAAMSHAIDVQALGVDFLALSGHKLLGPTGTGILYARQELQDELQPLLLGGETVREVSFQDHVLGEAPYRFEAGLQNYAGFIGLGAAVDYLDQLGPARIAKQLRLLNRQATDELRRLDRVRILGPDDPAQRSGILSFTVQGIDALDVAFLLDQGANIMTRAGRHCVHAWYNERGWPAAVRASFALYNSPEEADYFCWAVKDVLRRYG